MRPGARTPTACLFGFTIASCSFPPPPPLTDSAQLDGQPLDAPLACEANTIVCDDGAGRYVECGSDGVATRVIDCAMGCASDVEKCVDVNPSNGLAAYLDMLRDRDDVPEVTFSGDSTIDTNTGMVFNGPDAVTVPSETFDTTRVFLFTRLSITGTLKVTGTNALALVVDGDVEISGLLDVSADGSDPGPGAVTAANSCHGVGSMSNIQNPTQGGGGAGHYEAGASGGGANGGASGFVGGIATRDDDLVPLRGGCHGGATGEACLPPAPWSEGGGGGGAMQIVSTRAITLVGSGRIDASGGGGISVNACGPIGGPGGGSGGSILLEAPDIVLDGPGVVLSTKGGGGAAAGTGLPAHHGQDGGTTEVAAAGGVNSGYAVGGTGGTSSAQPRVGANGGSNSDGGGGGGSAGQTRINTQSGGINPQNGAAIRSHSSTGVVGSRLIP